MSNITVDFTITPDQIIALLGVLVSIVVAAIGGIYAIATNTKKYEYTEDYRKELFDWYSSTVSVMMTIIHRVQSGDFFKQEFHNEKMSLLAHLSSQAEIGRFYYPNVLDDNEYGRNKPSAYQGLRHLNLEFLFSFYEIAKNARSADCIERLWGRERYFTSAIFEAIEPRERNKKYAKYTELTMPEGRSLEDFFKANPIEKQL